MEHVTLYYRQGASDKVYQACLEPTGGGYIVAFAYGRRGATLQTLEQARQQSDRLRGWLTKAVGEPIATVPILTLPGWFVSSRVNGGMKVLNPKQIRQAVANGQAPKLTQQLIERICHQLDQKCRDVEL